MPWKENTTMSLREEFVTAVGQEGTNMSAVCREYGISRKRGYKWLRRYSTCGAAGLQDQSRRPCHSPTQTAVAVADVIAALRDANPAWGARKLKRRLEDIGETDLPAVSTITEILRRRGKLDPAESRKHQPYQRFEREAPNELLQMDFKGDFALTEGGRCYPLTVLDDHSRFLLGLFTCSNMRFKTVQQALTQIFDRYGLPDGMLMDNEDPWKGGPHAPYSQTTVCKLRTWSVSSRSRHRSFVRNTGAFCASAVIRWIASGVGQPREARSVAMCSMTARSASTMPTRESAGTDLGSARAGRRHQPS
ncbi:MAG: transposase [Anaerolineae bacterium]|nr:transposase [Anaerolineae bacterium]